MSEVVQLSQQATSPAVGQPDQARKRHFKRTKIRRTRDSFRPGQEQGNQTLELVLPSSDPWGRDEELPRVRSALIELCAIEQLADVIWFGIKDGCWRISFALPPAAGEERDRVLSNVFRQITSNPCYELLRRGFSARPYYEYCEDDIVVERGKL